MPTPPLLAIHLLNAGNELGTHADALRTALAPVAASVPPRLPLQGVDVLVYHDPASTIPELGAGGYTPSAHRVFLPIDVRRHEADPVAFGHALRGLLAHELHHCARWAGPGYGNTLGEALVSEGLACLFESEWGVGGPPFYARSLSPAQIETFSALARTHWDRTDHGHAQWFFGTQPDTLPRHAGYALGYAMAVRHARRTGLSASQLVHVPARAFLADLGGKE
ncbi:DUF2268 domain-containing protein [Paracidovorax konjaci]|uniref:Predicted Zn-dependent protease n=1 Tax=Paracidovorax konjaci TaxID=32040 RepID=A0A1I1VMC9_9BURK|nr:DUF2268 domain-containing putative Zn-dependent protease [Paracidovorax konjaci]SFD84232.1 Predicted Zn-dependent protease [Paracidovorax konjaci]